MNLQDINSPSDLLNANKQMMTDEQVAHRLDEMNPRQSMAIAIAFLNKLSKWHLEMAQKDGVDNPIAWQYDAVVLNEVVCRLKDIEL